MEKLNATEQATAVLLTNGLLDSSWGKTAHGLIRGSERFRILAVIDPPYSGRGTAEVIGDAETNIPILNDWESLGNDGLPLPEYAIISVALSGGVLPADWRQLVLETLSKGVSVVNGLHTHLSADAEFNEAAAVHGARLIDIRKPPPLDQLHFWSGRIFGVETPRIAVLGMDCAVGKRTTCRLVREMCRANDIDAEMVYTGQTGWLQGYPFGFILDATPNDFVSGEMEHAILACDAQLHPDLILVEGQSGLRNPAGPCGSELLLSGNIKGVILQHAPWRHFYEGYEAYGCRLPDPADEIDLIAKYGAKTIAIALNGEGGEVAKLQAYGEALQAQLGIPVVDPLHGRLSDFLPAIKSFMRDH